MTWYTPMHFGINTHAVTSEQLCNLQAGSLTENLFKMCKNQYFAKHNVVPKMHNLHAQFSDETIESVTEYCEDMTNDIIEKLAEYLTQQSKIMSKNEMFKNTVIDLSRITVKPDKKTQTLYNIRFGNNDEFSKEYKDGYLTHVKWENLIPCYGKGIYKLHPCRYIYYETKNIDKENQSVTIFCQEFINTKNYILPGASSVETVSIGHKDGESKIEIHRKNTQFAIDIYSSVTAKQLNLTGFSTRFYNKLIEDIRKSDRACTNEIINELDWATINSTVRTNFLLAQYNAKRENNVYYIDEPSSAEKNIIFDAPQSHYVQRIGPITIYDDAEPKIIERKKRTDDVHYAISEWETRGHIRHLKSGKTTYVKPSVHKRHGMEGEKPQKTIEFTNTSEQSKSKKPRKSNEPEMFDLNTLKNN